MRADVAGGVLRWVGDADPTDAFPLQTALTGAVIFVTILALPVAGALHVGDLWSGIRRRAWQAPAIRTVAFVASYGAAVACIAGLFAQEGPHSQCSLMCWFLD